MNVMKLIKCVSYYVHFDGKAKYVHSKLPSVNIELLFCFYICLNRRQDKTDSLKKYHQTAYKKVKNKHINHINHNTIMLDFFFFGFNVAGAKCFFLQYCFSSKLQVLKHPFLKIAVEKHP